jgi:hypothetical protein
MNPNVIINNQDKNIIVGEDFNNVLNPLLEIKEMEIFILTPKKGTF